MVLDAKTKGQDKMRCYKLTTQDNLTRKGEYNETKWGENVTHRAHFQLAADCDLCSYYWIHAYESALLASFFNSSHANIPNPKLWICKAEGLKKLTSDKMGAKTITTLRTMRLPDISTAARVRIAIKITMLVYKKKPFVVWAENWLSGKDRTTKTAYAAAAADAYAADAAYDAYAADAAYAAYAAANLTARDIHRIIKESIKEEKNLAKTKGQSE